MAIFQATVQKKCLINPISSEYQKRNYTIKVELSP